MADPKAGMSAEDVRAAVRAGILTEAQAAELKVLSEERAGTRAAHTSEDEPFEFFRGFAEVFVAIGLVILLGGITLMLTTVGGPGILVAIPAILAAAAWWMARYFTLRWRMNLPSMVLVSAFGTGIYVSALTALFQSGAGMRATGFVAAAVAACASYLWFRRFRLPFSMFVTGSFALLATYAAFIQLSPAANDLDSVSSWIQGFTPRGNLTFASLVFGMAAFVAAMRFDLRDPHRVGRDAATAFWLHLLAAGALVNATVGRVYSGGGFLGGGSANMVPTILVLAVFAVVALVIDRRSFLSAGIVYIGAVVYWAVAGDRSATMAEWATILILIGLFFTVLGTWWHPLRGALMRLLPDFPGKSRLPPYSERS
ncbi:MAG: hypothetical protein H6895_05240 [Defluviimonas sp.]|uniref:hypothetical protein n=1 Tax=Albidovulum sp. TaxID=1872424 RepID=UPI002A356DB6|nr:hypothetical protein [Defluviimonas sp.]